MVGFDLKKYSYKQTLTRKKSMSKCLESMISGLGCIACFMGKTYMAQMSHSK